MKENKGSAMLEEFKKAVIREDYVLLTGNYISALILNQFVYWTKRVYDHDKFVKEELIRLKRENNTVSFPLRSGWIYKTASQLNNELMLDVSDATIHKYLSIVLELGLIEQRNNPNHKWDRTLQYRVNLAKLHVELVKIGSGLDGFRTLTDEIPTLTDENAFSNSENGVSEFENRTTKNSKAIPEINTETNSETDNNPDAPDDDWGEMIPQEPQERIGLKNAVCTATKIPPELFKDEDAIDSLLAAGITADNIKAVFIGDKSWWWSQFWKGQRHQWPKVKDIEEEVGPGLAWLDDKANGRIKEKSSNGRSPKTKVNDDNSGLPLWLPAHEDLPPVPGEF